MWFQRSKKPQLKLFEQQMLTAIDAEGGSCSSYEVWKLVELYRQRFTSIGKLFLHFEALERRNLVSSYELPGTPERGGRKRRIYVLTNLGREALRQSRAAHSKA